jgi:phosphoesterase RecJ-like protein
VQKYEIAAMFELYHYLDRAPRRVVLTTHWNPDGDAAGSLLGLHALLEERGHAVTSVFPNHAAENLRWMPGYAKALVHEVDPDAVVEALQSADLVVALDYNTWSRTGEALAALLSTFSGTTALVDHHLQPDPAFVLSLSDTAASSTCELVVRLVGQMNRTDFNADAATCLFTGLLTDTGSFRYPSTSSQTLRAAALLVEAGAVPEFIHNNLFDAASPQRMHLWGEALRGMSFWEDGKLAVLSLDQNTLQRIGYAKGDTDGLVNQGLAVSGVEVSVFFREEFQGVKISFRSKGDRDVNTFSREYFGGGGHRNAAGGYLEGSLADALERLRRTSKGWLTALVLGLLATNTACQYREADSVSGVPTQQVGSEEDLIQQHRDQLTSERKAIDAFVAERGWPVQTGGTGWRMWRVEAGTGSQLQTDDVVELTAQATDLRRKTFYTYRADEPLAFRLGRDNIGEIGLHEVLLQCRRGDSLVVILPAHLAHGVAGDLGKIPPMSPVVYYLRVR